MVGGALGGLGGILVALPVGCGPIFSNSTCRMPTVVKGFAAGNVLGSALGAAGSANLSSCSVAERYGRALIGTMAGAGIGVARGAEARELGHLVLTDLGVVDVEDVDHLGVLDELPTLVGVVGQQPDGMGQLALAGVNPSDQDVQHEVSQLVVRQSVTGLLGLDEVGDQVVGWAGAAGGALASALVSAGAAKLLVF